MADYSELRRLSEAATPVPWAGEHDVYSASGQGERICKMATAEDSAFISAANPAAVLALIAENEKLRKALATIRDESSDLGACEYAADALTDSRKDVGHG